MRVKVLTRGHRRENMRSYTELLPPLLTASGARDGSIRTPFGDTHRRSSFRPPRRPALPRGRSGTTTTGLDHWSKTGAQTSIVGIISDGLPAPNAIPRKHHLPLRRFRAQAHSADRCTRRACRHREANADSLHISPASSRKSRIPDSLATSKSRRSACSRVSIGRAVVTITPSSGLVADGATTFHSARQSVRRAPCL